jgi:adenylate cyclase
MPDEHISVSEASRIAGVSPSTLQRWVQAGVIPVRRGSWTTAAAAQARVVARLRERGHSLAELRRAVQDGRLAFGYVEDLFPGRERNLTRIEASERTGLEEALIERMMALLGTPTAIEGTLNEQDVEAMEHIRDVLRAGFPLVALLQLIRVYAQSIRKIAEAEVRLFHLYVHEPLIRQGVDALQMAEEMEGLARDLLPITSPLMEYIHQRYLRFYIEQDVVGHMEAELGGQRQLGRVQMAFCFVDLTGFTRYTEEEGDEEAFDLVERFVETVEATLPAEALIVKTIGDEVMIVSPDPVMLTEWAIGFLGLFQERPQPRVGIHRGRAVYRDGDYFGTEVNLAHRVVARALGGEVMVTAEIVDAIGESGYLEFDPIGAVELKGFPNPVELFVARARETDAAGEQEAREER